MSFPTPIGNPVLINQAFRAMRLQFKQPLKRLVIGIESVSQQLKLLVIKNNICCE